MTANLMNTNPILHRLVPESERMDFVDKLFGLRYVLRIEPTVFEMAEHLAAPQYNGGYWEFYALSNGGFYMAPRVTADADVFTVTSMNGFEGQMTADALGITACLYAYSHLSFEPALADVCGEHYHLLREYAMDHAEVKSILAAID